MTAQTGIVKAYIAEKQKTQQTSVKNIKNVLNQFFTFIHKDPHAVTREDLLKYYKHLDSGEFKQSYKKSQMSILKSFFDTIDRNIFVKYQFRHPRIEDHEIEIFSIEQLEIILIKAKAISPEFFMKLILLACVGMRASECLTLKVKDIHLEERYLKTGYEIGAQKSTKKNGLPLTFCFPQEVADLLFDYLQYRESKGINSDWLFPGDFGDHAKYRQLDNLLKALPVSFSRKLHSFRRTHETLLHQAGAPLEVIEFLSNHASRSIVLAHYVNRSLEERKKLTDQYFPLELKKLLRRL